MFTIEEKIRYSETSHTGRLNMSGIVDFFQDCCTLHSDSVGYTVERHWKEGTAWILNSWQIVVERYPKGHEEILISTWPTGFERFIGTRNFTMKTRNGEMLAYANSIWSLMDMKSMRPTRPGDEMISISGKPYDTLEEVIGIRPSCGSLAEYGVTYKQVELLEDGNFDLEGIRNAISEKTKLVEIQRSKGYLTRPTLSVQQIGEAIAFVKSINPEIICMVDNCYGEFVQRMEPSDLGADMVVGSLIKNPGGGLAPIGGYIAGTKECVERAAYRLTSPGLGKEVGATLGVMQSFYQGLFLAPTVTAAALKGAIFAANLYESLGFKVIPDGKEERYDIIQAVEFGMPEGVVAFCEGIQSAAPVDSYVTPEPWAMPGYDSDVIMAAGAFVQGSSIELSADGPIKPPYAVYFQGGLTWPHAKLGIMKSLQRLYEKGIVKW